MSALGCFGIWLGLAIGNLLFQYLTSKRYATAVERSYFQALPLFAVWLAQVWRPA
jgi:hypothetical protein